MTTDKTSDTKKKKKKAKDRAKAADSFVSAVAETTGLDEDDICPVIYEAHTRSLPMAQRALAAAKENSVAGTVLAVTEAYGHGHHAYEIGRHIYDAGIWLTKGVFGRS